MATFAVGAGTKLQAGLQSDYFKNTSGFCTINTPVNITSFNAQPSVEKGTEENLLATKVKDSSYLLSITVDGSFDANLRPEMTDWLFKAALQNATATTSGDTTTYTLAAPGVDPLGSTLVLQKNGHVFTYPAVSIRSFTLNAPNNDFASVSCDIVGREEIDAGEQSAIDSTNYEAKTLQSLNFEDAGFIITKGVFHFDGDTDSDIYCIESATLTIDNGLEDAPRCYQDGKYANIPVMGRRSVTLDFNMPYTDQVETWKDSYLLDTRTAYASLEFSTADEAYTIKVEIPALSLTSIDSSISGTGVIEASLSGEVIQPANGEPLTISVIDNNYEP